MVIPVTYTPLAPASKIWAGAVIVSTKCNNTGAKIMIFIVIVVVF
jgi:hypothetical protein